jgi:hypothetical protein
MTEQIELIEQRIDQTKASLADKLEALETQVTDAVQATTETVTETVDAVKDTVDNVKEKVRSAGEFLSMKQQAERNPWLVFGGALAVGCFAGYVLGGEAKRATVRRRTTSAKSPEFEPVAAVASSAAPLREEPHSWFRDQLGNFSGLAIGALMGVLRDAVASELPDGLGKSVSQEMDRFTTRLGGEPIAGPVLPPPKQPAV